MRQQRRRRLLHCRLAVAPGDANHTCGGLACQPGLRQPLQRLHRIGDDKLWNILAGGVGVGLGLLLAPASGEETRGNISHKVHEFGDRVRDKIQDQRGESSGTYGT